VSETIESRTLLVPQLRRRAESNSLNPAFGTLHRPACCLCTIDLVVDTITPECQMSKSNKPSKHSRSPKIVARAQRAAQAVVRSPSDSRQRSLGAGSTVPPPKHNDPEQDALQKPATALQTETPPKHNDSRQENLLIEKPATALGPATALEDDCKQTMADNESKRALDFSSATANVRAYQAKLLEIAQANMQFALEFAQRLAAVRSPPEFLSVIAEYTNKRIAMFQKHSMEMAEFTALR
jgi:Phasin protein